MLDFKEITLKDKPAIDSLLLKSNVTINDYSFGSLFAWRSFYDKKICIKNDRLHIRFDDKYYIPIGGTDFADDISCYKKGSVFLCTSEQYEQIKQKMDCKFVLKPDYFDYVYNASDLALLPGKKYHTKRTHINNFIRSYSYTCEEITPSNMPGIKKAADRWFELNQTSEHDITSLDVALKNYFDLGFYGIFITANGKICAFCFGEQLSEDTFVTHHEKAFGDITGSYAMINRQMAQNLYQKYSFINREEDIGLEGLRKAKLSYYPCKMAQKGLLYI